MENGASTLRFFNRHKGQISNAVIVHNTLVRPQLNPNIVLSRGWKASAKIMLYAKFPSAGLKVQTNATMLDPRFPTDVSHASRYEEAPVI